jgi:hypothetical protein
VFCCRKRLRLSREADECKPLLHGRGAARHLVPHQQKERQHGKAVQVEPMKPMLKPPGTQRLKPKYDNLLSSFAFNFNLRRYSSAERLFARVPLVRRCRLNR